jgi:hypothetical protein
LVINYKKDTKEKDVTEKVEQISEKISLSTLPVSTTF